MALTIDNCLILQGLGTNFMYADCCCEKTCNVTTDADVTIDGWLNVSLWAISMEVWYNGNKQNGPFSMTANESFELRFNICPGSIGETDILEIRFDYDGSLFDKFSFDFEAIAVSDDILPNPIAFGNVNVGSGKNLNLSIENSTICSYEYTFSTSCPDVTFTNNPTTLLTPGGKATVPITWTPESIGVLRCDVFVDVGCQTSVIEANGEAVTPPEPPPGGGNNVSGKRTVVDCPTSDCRLANGQPNFSRQYRNGINQISRATRPKGGPGRGTNFR